MRPILALAAGLTLVSPALAAINPPNAFNDKLRALAPADRDGALRRAVTMENQRCGRLSQTSYRGMYGNLGFWQAVCTPGGAYAIFAGPDGSVQVRPCDQMKGLKLPACTVAAASAATDKKRRR